MVPAFLILNARLIDPGMCLVVTAKVTGAGICRGAIGAMASPLGALSYFSPQSACLPRPVAAAVRSEVCARPCKDVGKKFF